jgi:hypothetical protein
MNLITIRLLFSAVLAALLLTGCGGGAFTDAGTKSLSPTQGAELEHPNPESLHTPTQTTICEVRKNRAASIGMLVRVKGVYISDGLTFGYFKDSNCGSSSNSIRLNTSNKSISDSSVAEFDRYLQKECQGSRSGYCVNDFELDVVGVVSENDEGLLRLELVHVYKVSPVRAEGTSSTP